MACDRLFFVDFLIAKVFRGKDFFGFIFTNKVKQMAIKKLFSLLKRKREKAGQEANELN